jgi:thiol:disulfide interchange protein DsbD
MAFIGGLILNFMPCVFPILGLKVMGFVKQTGEDRRKVTLHGLIFTLGVLVSFWILTGILIALRASGEGLGWGFQLQSPAFVFALTVVLLIFALNLSGLFEVGGSAIGIGSKLAAMSGPAGSFFSGILATVVATPCAAPFLAPALGAALTLSAFESLIVFTSIALGLSLPYLFLSIFPGVVKLLPRPGAWMESFKQLLAFPLYATTGYLLWVLGGQIDEFYFLSAIFGLVFIAMAAWVYGRWSTPARRSAVRRWSRVGTLALFTFGIYIGYPLEHTSRIQWESWSPEKVIALQVEGHPVYVDFTARWCATCQTNKVIVFSSDAVVNRFREKDVVALKADWTLFDPLITNALASHGRSAVPFNLIYDPNQIEPIILPELLTPGIVLEALDKL